MYEFPLPTWYMTGWWPTVYHLIVLAGGLGAMSWIVRRSRIPRVYDAATIAWLAMGVTILFLFPTAEHWEERRAANAEFFYAIWGSAFVATLYSWSRIESSKRGQHLGRSLGAFVLSMVVVFVFAIPFTMPNLAHPREVANKTQCLNNMRQVGMAIYNYSQDSNGFLPLASRYSSSA